jgi:hypothetical protein
MAQQESGRLPSRSARSWVAIALLAFGIPRPAQAQIAVVVNPSNSIEELSLDNLRRLFSDPYFTTNRFRREIAGIRYEQTAGAVFKLELRSLDRRGADRASELGLQLALAF